MHDNKPFSLSVTGKRASINTNLTPTPQKLQLYFPTVNNNQRKVQRGVNFE
jgi:hypothetical protein